MGDTITGCTWLAGFEGGHNYRVHPFNWLALLFSCSGRASCSPPLLLLLLKIFFHSFLSLHFSSTLNLCLLSLSFFLYLFVLSWTLPLSSVSPLSLFVAGFSRLAVVCWGCCTTFCPRMPLSVFWRQEKPWISGFSPAKHKPGMTPTCIYTQSVCIQQSWDAPLQQEVKNYLRKSCWQTA